MRVSAETEVASREANSTKEQATIRERGLHRTRRSPFKMGCDLWRFIVTEQGRERRL